MSKTKTGKLLFAYGIDPLIESITSAKEFIEIVSFQLTSLLVIDALRDACHRGVKVSVITLPPDSYA